VAGKTHNSPYTKIRELVKEYEAISHPNEEQERFREIILSIALWMQDGKTHSTQPARIVLQKQDNQSQRKFAFDRLGPNGSNNRGSREDQHESNRVEQPRDNRSGPPVPMAPRNHSHRVDWREDRAESKYRKARVPDMFPYFVNQLLLV
jgi:hypothetical protein